jgi:hypothetical protein
MYEFRRLTLQWAPIAGYGRSFCFVIMRSPEVTCSFCRWDECSGQFSARVRCTTATSWGLAVRNCLNRVTLLRSARTAAVAARYHAKIVLTCSFYRVTYFGNLKNRKFSVKYEPRLTCETGTLLFPPNSTFAFFPSSLPRHFS